MAWIERVGETEADADLRAAFDASRDRQNGRVDNILSIHSLHTGGMRAHQLLYAQVMAGTATLRKVERELIALVVSKANDCHY